MKKFSFKNLRIRQKIMLIFTGLVIILALTFGGYSIYEAVTRAKADMEYMEKNLTDRARQKLRDHVQAAYIVAEKSYNQASSREAIVDRFGPNLKNLVDIPMEVITSEYLKTDPNVPGMEEQRKMMTRGAQYRAQREIGNFRYGDSGYFWINDAKPSMVMHPIVPELDGRDLSEFSKDGQVVMADGTNTPMFVEMVRKTRESPTHDGFVMYYWPHPNDKTRWVPKISYVRLFEPWGWIIGTGVYVDQAEKEARVRAVETLKALKFNQGEFIFVISSKNISLIHPEKELMGIDVSDYKDADGQTPYKNMVDLAMSSGEGFIGFRRPAKGRPGAKLAYIRYFPEWEWVIGAEVYVDDIQSEIVARQSELDSELKKQMLFIVIVTAAMIIFSLLTAFWLCLRFIERPLRHSVKILNNIARGDIGERMALDQEDEIGALASAMDEMTSGLEEKAGLAIKISEGNLSVDILTYSEKDVLGSAFQTMIAKLNQVILDIRNASAQVSSGSRQVSGSSQSLSEGAVRQAASLEEITSSLTVVSSQTKMNAENARSADALTCEARDAADAGDRQMADMISAMSDIQKASSEISKIIKTIDDIAFQTNLLALNAAVEAARAGTHGKGFAVVAQEVRNLASKSAEAAHETEKMIQESVKKVDIGTKILDKTADSLKSIVDRIGQASRLVDEISAASTQQAEGIAQINMGLDQIEQVTHTVSSNSEQTASAALQLSSQAQLLEKSLTMFKLKNEAENRRMTVSQLENRALPPGIAGLSPLVEESESLL